MFKQNPHLKVTAGSLCLNNEPKPEDIRSEWPDKYRSIKDLRVSPVTDHSVTTNRCKYIFVSFVFLSQSQRKQSEGRQPCLSAGGPAAVTRVRANSLPLPDSDASVSLHLDLLPSLPSPHQPRQSQDSLLILRLLLISFVIKAEHSVTFSPLTFCAFMFSGLLPAFLQFVLGSDMTSWTNPGPHISFTPGCFGGT